MAAATVGVSGAARRRLDRFLVHVILLGGLVGVIVAVQLLVLLALGRFPTGEEKTVLAVSMIARRSRRSCTSRPAGASSA